MQVNGQVAGMANGAELDLRDTMTNIGRIVSVTGSKSIIMLDNEKLEAMRRMRGRPEMGTLLAIDTAGTIVLGLITALSVPVPAHRDGEQEVWIAELALVGELSRLENGETSGFQRGISVYPALGDHARMAIKAELKKAFSADLSSAVEVGRIRQDATIPAMVKTDDLLGKHFAILGTTGTGKSCTTALILRAILQKNPQAHIVLLDPHNEYATSFADLAEVVSPSDFDLPYWLLTFEELVEVILSDPKARKAEVEILQDLIPACKSRYGQAQRANSSVIKRSESASSRFTVDTPVPYRISDLVSMIDDRMGMLENKRDLSPYRHLKMRIETVSRDQRYAFMFGNLTVADSMADVLARIFRVPVNDKPITILELTGLPTEVINVVVSVLCRMTFDFALWGNGAVPVTLVCEEAHRYVPHISTQGFEPAKRAIAKIAKEGRKYGASLCIVTQRPAEIDPTILSQCNTVFALRMANDRDQEIVQAAISDTGSGLLEFLPALGAREAIAFGDGVTLPVRIKFDILPKQFLPRSSTAKFSEKWQVSEHDPLLLQRIVDRWRNSGLEANIDVPTIDAQPLDGDHDMAPELEAMERAVPRQGSAHADHNDARPATGSAPARQLRKPQSSVAIDAGDIAINSASLTAQRAASVMTPQQPIIEQAAPTTVPQRREVTVGAPQRSALAGSMATRAPVGEAAALGSQANGAEQLVSPAMRTAGTQPPPAANQSLTSRLRRRLSAES